MADGKDGKIAYGYQVVLGKRRSVNDLKLALELAGFIVINVNEPSEITTREPVEPATSPQGHPLDR